MHQQVSRMRINEQTLLTHRFPLLHVVDVEVLVLPRRHDELPPVGGEVRSPDGVVLEVDSLRIECLVETLSEGINSYTDGP